MIATARPILQSAVAASLAWLVATELVGHSTPFFAPISAVITLGSPSASAGLGRSSWRSRRSA